MESATDVPDTWPCSHFSLSNPQGPDEGNLPLLLRRMADHVAALGDGVTVLDLTLSSETTATGDWWALTLYFTADRSEG